MSERYARELVELLNRRIEDYKGSAFSSNWELLGRRYREALKAYEDEYGPYIPKQKRKK